MFNFNCNGSLLNIYQILIPTSTKQLVYVILLMETGGAFMWIEVKQIRSNALTTNHVACCLKGCGLS